MTSATTAASTMRLPEHQTLHGSQDPLVPVSPRAVAERDTRHVETRAASQEALFQDYLDTTSITYVEAVSKKHRPDAVDLIGQESVYPLPSSLTGL